MNNLFAAMKNADAIMLSNCFSGSAILQTITKSNEGKTVIKNEPVNDFISFVSHEAKGNKDERITMEKTKAYWLLAMVWAIYLFYYKGKFSHSGIDSF